jgi:hypothetical protein
LHTARSADRALSDEIRLDPSREEGIRKKELIPFAHLTEFLGLPDTTCFRLPRPDRGVDVEYGDRNTPEKLQITLALARFGQLEQPRGEAGKSHMLGVKKLTEQGHLSGYGRFVSVNGKIVHDEGARDGAEVRTALESGIYEAIHAKKSKAARDTTLLVHAVDFGMKVNADGFRVIVEKALKRIRGLIFREVVVLDYPQTEEEHFVCAKHLESGTGPAFFDARASRGFLDN